MKQIVTQRWQPHNTWQLRESAIYLLGFLFPLAAQLNVCLGDDVQQLLPAALRDPHARIRETGCWAAQRLAEAHEGSGEPDGIDAQSVLEPLMALMLDDDAGVCKAALRALHALVEEWVGPERPDVLPQLMKRCVEVWDKLPALRDTVGLDLVSACMCFSPGNIEEERRLALLVVAALDRWDLDDLRRVAALLSHVRTCLDTLGREFEPLVERVAGRLRQLIDHALAALSPHQQQQRTTDGLDIGEMQSRREGPALNEGLFLCAELFVRGLDPSRYIPESLLVSFALATINYKNVREQGGCGALLGSVAAHKPHLPAVEEALRQATAATPVCQWKSAGLLAAIGRLAGNVRGLELQWVAPFWHESALWTRRQRHDAAIMAFQFGRHYAHVVPDVVLAKLVALPPGLLDRGNNENESDSESEDEDEDMDEGDEVLFYDDARSESLEERKAAVIEGLTNLILEFAVERKLLSDTTNYHGDDDDDDDHDRPKKRRRVESQNKSDDDDDEAPEVRISASRILLLYVRCLHWVDDSVDGEGDARRARVARALRALAELVSADQVARCFGGRSTSERQAWATTVAKYDTNDSELVPAILGK